MVCGYMHFYGARLLSTAPTITKPLHYLTLQWLIVCTLIIDTLFDHGCQLYSKVVAVEPFLPEWVCGAVNIIPAIHKPLNLVRGSLMTNTLGNDV